MNERMQLEKEQKEILFIRAINDTTKTQRVYQ